MLNKGWLHPVPEKCVHMPHGPCANKGDLPFQVHIKACGPSIRCTHCDGSLLNKNYVITAASCLTWNIGSSWKTVLMIEPNNTYFPYEQRSKLVEYFDLKNQRFYVYIHAGEVERKQFEKDAIKRKVFGNAVIIHPDYEGYTFTAKHKQNQIFSHGKGPWNGKKPLKYIHE